MEQNQKLESIASHVATTFQSFRDLEDALTERNSFDDSSEGTGKNEPLLVIGNDFIRFKMWAGNQAAHQSGPSSLDHRLREAPHLQQQVIYLLKDICESLEDASSRVSESPGSEKGRDWSTRDNDASSMDAAQDEGSDFSDSDPGPNCDAPTTVLSTLLLDVREAIDCLLRLSVAIANPAPHERFRKLGAGASEDVSFYEPHDIAYVRDKFPMVKYQLANAMGKFITRRRQFFKYRLAHHEKLASGIETLASNKETDTGRTEVIPKTVASSLPEQFKALAKFDPQATVIDEDIRSDTGISETSYATSAGFAFEGTDQEMHKPAPPLRVPPRPSAAEDGIFECPFCYRIISAKTRTAWKRHVFGDLRPYTCVLSHCTESNTDFDRRHNWQLHVSKYHWRSWACPFKCHQPFTSATEFSIHIKNLHLPTGTEEEIRSVTSLGEKPAPDDTSSHCLLCGQSVTGLKKYVKHVGKHLEQLALLALPRLGTEELEGEMGSKEHNSVKSGTDANSLYGSSTTPSPILAPQQKPVPGLAIEEGEDKEETGSYGYDENPKDPHGLSEKALGKLPATQDFWGSIEKHAEEDANKIVLPRLEILSWMTAAEEKTAEAEKCFDIAADVKRYQCNKCLKPFSREQNLRCSDTLASPVIPLTADAPDAQIQYSPTQTPPLQDKTESPAGTPTCSNCFTRTTPLWRRGPDDRPLCNACGLYLKLCGIARPLSSKMDDVVKHKHGSGSVNRNDRSRYGEVGQEELDKKSQLEADVKRRTNAHDQEDGGSVNRITENDSPAGD
ncbi:transcription factor [Fusarium sporotrichioides]|uniref:Transcription factor n=1 Tax=Fusarium sporotrichioides TaxID=5514 RepID=A0A395RXE5_FUSSP|nr:transcription factor [Fusarium sporotrichioides]